jgi:hypothetical protein
MSRRLHEDACISAFGSFVGGGVGRFCRWAVGCRPSRPGRTDWYDSLSMADIAGRGDRLTAKANLSFAADDSLRTPMAPRQSAT